MWRSPIHGDYQFWLGYTSNYSFSDYRPPRNQMFAVMLEFYTLKVYGEHWYIKSLSYIHRPEDGCTVNISQFDSTEKNIDQVSQRFLSIRACIA